MALEDKKSQLQPSSVQSQQYRLQYSSLQGRADEAIKYNQPSALAPKTSQFVGGPAPVALSAPVAQPAQAPTVPKNYKAVAAVLDGNTYFTSSAADVDLNIVATGSFSLVFMIKPDVFPTREKQYLFHAYTGSFASHSLEVTLEGQTLQVKGTNGNQYVRYYTTIPTANVGNQENGYTLIEIVKGAQQPSVPSRPFEYTPIAVKVGNKPAYFARGNSAALTSLDFSLADHLYVGGTAAVANSNFSGSINYVMVGPAGLQSNIYTDLKDGVIKPTDVTPQIRTYLFDANGPLEVVGSLADINVSLGITGSYSTTAGSY